EGNLGYAMGTPDGVIRASYSRPGNEGWNPTIALIVRRFSTPDAVPHRGALEAVAMSYSDGFSIFNLAAKRRTFNFWATEPMRSVPLRSPIGTSRPIPSSSIATPPANPTPVPVRVS